MITQAKILAFPDLFWFLSFFLFWSLGGGGHTLENQRFIGFIYLLIMTLKMGKKKTTSVNEENVKNVSHHLLFEEVVDLTYSHLFFSTGP